MVEEKTVATVLEREGQTDRRDGIPGVSVVIPSFNTRRFLRRALDSVLEQDYSQVECIVVDGGSTDGTIEILQSYGDRIRWISEPDNGHADAINKGWHMSSGEILTWLNTDDLWAGPTVVSQAVDYLAKHADVDVLYGDCGVVDENGELVGMAYVHPWDLEYSAVNADHCIPQPASFIRRTALQNVGWLDPNIFTKDRELWLRIGLQGKLRYEPMLLAHASNEEGISFDGPRVAPAIVQVARKFFSLPGVPPAIRRRKRTALSYAYARAAWYAWWGGRHGQLMFRYTVAALLADPANWKSLLHLYAGHTRVGMSGKPPGRAARLLGLGVRAVRVLRREFPAAFRGGTPLRGVAGSRDVEWAWAAATIPCGPGGALDVSRGGSFLSLAAAQRGFTTTAVDGGHRTFQHPDVRHMPIEAVFTCLGGSGFDLIMNCYGLADSDAPSRHGPPPSPDQSPKSTMMQLYRLLRPGGTLLFTSPLMSSGETELDDGFVTLDSLPQLLSPFEVDSECFWKLSATDRFVWRPVSRDEVTNPPDKGSSSDDYPQAIGCFVLRRPLQETS